MHSIWAFAIAFWLFWFPQFTIPQHTGATASSGGGAAPSFVQANGENGSASVAYSSNVTAGNALYAFVFGGPNGGTVAVTSTHNTWTLKASGVLATDGDEMGIACAIAAGTQADTVSATINSSSANISRMQIYEISNATCTLDTTTSPSGGYVTTDSTQSSPISGGNITTTTNNDLMFFFAGNEGSAATGTNTWTAGSGFSNLTCVNDASGYGCTGTSGGPVRSGVEIEVLSTAGTGSASISATNPGSQEYGTIYAAFKP